MLLSIGYFVDSFIIPEEIIGKIVPPALFIGTAYGAYGIGALIGSRLDSSRRFQIQPIKLKGLRSRFGSIFGNSGLGSRFRLS